MKLLFDTDVLLDVLLERRPFAEPAAQLLSLAESREIAGFVSATSVTTLHYLAARAVGAKRTGSLIQRLLRIVEVAPVNGPVLQGALASGFVDFEDAVVAEAARQVGAEGIVTRNVKDYGRSAVPAYLPPEILEALAGRKDPD